ncbi:MAG: biotin/lipoate A/B protein ligase family protein [Akkermansiaceae bacterium]
MPVLFDSLDAWYDEHPRTGAENMAIDQLLMEQVKDRPLLRVYQWSEPSVSFGYFLHLADAMESFSDSGLTYTRRWTGGGIVDHRADVTYTLVIPKCSVVANTRGAGSYRKIHSVIAAALVKLGKDVEMVSSDSGNNVRACFANPVANDVVDRLGNKLAGAGQRRTRYGLLHQGSVLAGVHSRELFEQLMLLLTPNAGTFTPDASLLGCAVDLAKARYSSAQWLNKR